MICSISNSVSGFPWFHGSILWNEYLLYLKLEIFEVVFVVYCLNLNQCSYDAGLFSSRVCSVETAFNKDLGFRCYHVAAQVWWQDIASGANWARGQIEASPGGSAWQGKRLAATWGGQGRLAGSAAAGAGCSSIWWPWWFMATSGRAAWSTCEASWTTGNVDFKTLVSDR